MNEADPADSPEIIGAWRLVSMMRPESGAYWNDQPLGLIVYMANGLMTAQLYDSRRPRLGLRWESASAEAARNAYVGLITYFGTYSLDRNAAMISHFVQGAMAPDWIGSTLVRAYRFLTPDLLELRVVTDGMGHRVTNGTVVIWERIFR